MLALQISLTLSLSLSSLRVDVSWTLSIAALLVLAAASCLAARVSTRPLLVVRLRANGIQRLYSKHCVLGLGGRYPYPAVRYRG